VTLAESFGRTLVIAPHPDDEILGCGGLMARMADEGGELHVAVVTKGQEPTFTATMTATVRAEALAAHRHLGVYKTHWLDQPAAMLAETPHADLNASLRAIVHDIMPQTLLLPFVGDIHLDHQLIFLSALVAARPHQLEFPKTILAYETVSETNWNAPYVTPGFHPQVFIDIGSQLQRKLDAMAMFRSQLRVFPHERSLETLQALAVVRGTSMHRSAAEAFVAIRHIL
jgi:LmbE family N-acetylglucosaminyl deacetylase